MKKSGYEQFFSKASEAKRQTPKPDKPRFPLKTRAGSSPALEEQRLRSAMQMKPKRRPPFPWKASAGLAVSLFLAGIYVMAPNAVEKILSKVEIRAFGPAGAEEKPAEKSKTDAATKEKAAGSATGAGPGKSPEDKSPVAEELSHFEKLKQRKEELDVREKELSELEEELQRQKIELDKRITQLEEMRNQIAQTLKERVEVDQEKVNKLVDLYSNMKPKQAADILGSLNEELAVEVLAKMKKKNAAEIMNLLPPEKARILSEKYTGYRRISSQEPKG